MVAKKNWKVVVAEKMVVLLSCAKKPGDSSESLPSMFRDFWCPKLRSSLPSKFAPLIVTKLVGGFKPFEARRIGSFPQVRVKRKNISNHHLVNHHLG